MAARRTPEEARAAREAKLDEVREQLYAQVEKLVTGEDWKQALTFAAKFRSRSVNNGSAEALLDSGFFTPRVRRCLH